MSVLGFRFDKPIFVAWQNRHGWTRKHILRHIARGPDHSQTTTLCGLEVPADVEEQYGGYIPSDVGMCAACLRNLERDRRGGRDE